MDHFIHAYKNNFGIYLDQEIARLERETTYQLLPEKERQYKLLVLRERYHLRGYVYLRDEQLDKGKACFESAYRIHLNIKAHGYGTHVCETLILSRIMFRLWQFEPDKLHNLYNMLLALFSTKSEINSDSCHRIIYKNDNDNLCQLQRLLHLISEACKDEVKAKVHERSALLHFIYYNAGSNGMHYYYSDLKKYWSEWIEFLKQKENEREVIRNILLLDFVELGNNILSFNIANIAQDYKHASKNITNFEQNYKDAQKKNANVEQNYKDACEHHALFSDTWIEVQEQQLQIASAPETTTNYSPTFHAVPPRQFVNATVTNNNNNNNNNNFSLT